MAPGLQAYNAQQMLFASGAKGTDFVLDIYDTPKTLVQSGWMPKLSYTMP
jgi:hypothetical protein